MKQPLCYVSYPGETFMRPLLAAAVLLGISAVLVFAQDKSKNGEEGHLLALESAWNHAEQSKDAAALKQLIADSTKVSKTVSHFRGAGASRTCGSIRTEPGSAWRASPR